MPANATQLAQLSSILGKPQALALIEYIDSQIQQPQIQIGVLRDSVVPVPAYGAPPRDLDADFVVSPTRAAWVSYTVALTIAATIIGSQTDLAQVDLLIDGVQVDSTKTALAATLIAGLALTYNYRMPLSAFVPAGSTVRLASSGTGTISLLSSHEVLQ